MPEDPIRLCLVEAWEALRHDEGDFDVPRDDFVERVRATVLDRFGADVDPETLPDRLALRDVYLVMGCLNRSDRATRCFMGRYGAHIEQVARKYTGYTAMAQDVRSEMLSTLFLPRHGDDESSARLYNYQGLGSLNAFLRVTAHRLALDAFRRLRPTEGDERLARLPDPQESVEAQVIDAELVRALLTLLRECLEGLDPESRALLAAYFRDGRVLRGLAEQHGVNIATVHRRIKKALGEVRRCLKRRALADLGLDGQSLSDMLGPLGGGLDLGGLFATMALVAWFFSINGAGG